MSSTGAPRARVAAISLHTSPMDRPGSGDSGGMNVFVRSVAARLGDRGVDVDIFTRCAGRGVPTVQDVGPGARVIQVPAGPCAELPKERLGDLGSQFADTVLRFSAEEGRTYDLVHAHYWLSCEPAISLAETWAVPLVASFHTLGRVKDLTQLEPEPRLRLAAEDAVIAASDRIVVSTPAEAAHVTELYDAPARRVRVVSPGVDTTRFRPRPGARPAESLPGGRVAMFVGRLQPIKGPDLAVEAVARAVSLDPVTSRDLSLVVVGGPSGDADSASTLRELASRLGIEDRVLFLPPRPHEDLPDLYSAADVLLMPSRSEAFGLVALEAQACGVPVVASAVGGVRYVVDDGTSGLLVGGEDPEGFARALIEVLSDEDLAKSMSAAAVARASGFPWEATADGLADVYGELLPRLATEQVTLGE